MAHVSLVGASCRHESVPHDPSYGLIQFFTVSNFIAIGSQAQQQRIQKNGYGWYQDCPRGSKYPIFKDPGPKYHSGYGFRDQNP